MGGLASKEFVDIKQCLQYLESGSRAISVFLEVKKSGWSGRYPKRFWMATFSFGKSGEKKVIAHKGIFYEFVRFFKELCILRGGGME